MHLEWRDGPHHAQVVHHEEAVAGQAVQASTGKATGCQQVAVHIKVRQAARVGIKLMLHLESAWVTERHLRVQARQKAGWSIGVEVVKKSSMIEAWV